MKSPPEARFSAVADLYARHRPTYPDGLFTWIAEATGISPPALLADVGCGTGISTRLLAARGYDVVGIDPNEDMLAQARVAGGHYAHGSSDASGLPPASVELVTAAQAFHWFDVSKSMTEFRRILKPQGWVVAFWNLRADDIPGYHHDYNELLKQFSSEYIMGGDKYEVADSIRAFPGIANLVETTVPMSQTADWERAHGRAWSASYVAHGVSDVAGFDAALRRTFDAHAVQGQVTLEYRCVAMAWQLP